MASTDLSDRMLAYVRDLQGRITGALEAIDGSRFREDVWQRPGGGGGWTRVLADGAVFERAGVNVSDVHGQLRPEFAGQLPGDGLSFRAVGISLVLHPRSPRVPTVHANYRRIQRGAAAWFGGGADLTPYYVVADDAVHFHATLAHACAEHDPALYPRLKAWCDDYFFLPHRQEPRGIGGIFFDYFGVGAEARAGRDAVAPSAIEGDAERLFDFVRSVGDAFLPAYLPIVERRRNDAWGDRERDWQLERRGRYVEFNLVWDRGTTFGLRTDGRIESILMSLPPKARWLYDHHPEPGSAEAASLEAILARRDWLGQRAHPKQTGA